MQDAIVYGTDDADDVVLLPLLNAGQEQVNENASGSGTTQSNQRCENGSGGARNTSTYRQTVPTPDGENNACPPPPPAPVIVISQLYGGGGNAGATYRNDYVELFNRGAAPVDITGWSLQYRIGHGKRLGLQQAAARRHDRAGRVLPGLACIGSQRCAPADGERQRRFDQHVRDSGKIALVDNFEALARHLSEIQREHLRDLVGYGSANCREGSATAPRRAEPPPIRTAILRKLGGATDTDQNGDDFAHRRAESAPDGADRRTRTVCRELRSRAATAPMRRVMPPSR